MPKYMFEFNYSKDGIKGLMKDGGSKRREVVAETVKSVGGKLEAFYFAFGRYDAIVLADLPDAASAAAASLVVGASGSGEFVTVALLTPEEVDQAVKKQVSYKAPGA